MKHASPPPPKASKPKHEDIYPFGLQNDLGSVAGPAGSSTKQVESVRTAPSVCPHHLNLILPVGSTTTSGGEGMVTSASTNSIQSPTFQHSRASSITDLSAEAEILDRAIRHNDVASVKRILDLHHGRFVVNLHGSVMDKWSGDSITSACLSQEVEILLRKSQTLLDRFHQQESVSSGEPETPVVFVNALHVAVEHRALDVARLLLRYGVEPNEGGVAPTSESCANDKFNLSSTRRESVFSDDGPPSRSTPSPSQPSVSVREDLPLHLATVYTDPTGRALTYSEVYTRETLYALPALYLAVACRSPEMVQILLKYGANANFQDKYGSTPLHIAACQDKASWECILPLVENGAKVGIKNKCRVSPTQLLNDLSKVQEAIMVDIFSALVPVHKNNNSNHHYGNGRSLFRKLHTDARTGRQKSHEEEIVPAASHLVATGRSRSLRNSTDESTNESYKDPSPERFTFLFPRAGSRANKSQVGDSDQLEVGEVEKHLQTLIKMASNSECVDLLMMELFNHCSGLIEMLGQLGRASVYRNVAKLLNQLLQTIILEENNAGAAIAHGLCTLLCLALALIQGGQALQYTALLILNKIIDTSIVRGAVHTIVQLHPALLPVCHGEGGTPSEAPAARPPPPVSTRRLLPLRKQTSCERGPEEYIPVEHGASQPQETSLIGILSRVHPGIVLNILHNAITLHKRVVGTKQQCTPIHRWRHCSYHCLQILSARVLLFMSQNTTVQTEMSTEAQLRILVATLDSTHDPQLLCLVLQVVATLAFDPRHHAALVALDVPDALTQLILPSDEWYYTNHSTKYARFVKHHATRTLVYMGLHNRVAGRVYLFDLLEDSEVCPGNMGDGSENAYILGTSAAPKVVKEQGKVIAMSIEGAILQIVKEAEELGSSLEKFGEISADVNSSAFLHVFLSTLPAVVHPVIVLRLLVHCLVGSRAHRRGPRGSATSVSRTSSVDVDEIGELQRRSSKLNLTLLDTPTSPQGPRVFRSSSVKSTRGELRVVIDEGEKKDEEEEEEDTGKNKGKEKEKGIDEASPSPQLALKRPSRFASLRRKKSKSTASIGQAKSASELSVEEDILSFQRQLQNLPRFEPAPDDLDPRFNRPRSRSVPKVTFEGSLCMTPPPPHSVSFHRMDSMTPWGVDAAIPPPLTPQLSVDASQMPKVHTSVLRVLQMWALTCHADLESLSLVRRDLREFLDRIESLGDTYEEWTQRMRFLVDAGERAEDISNNNNENNPENIDDQYYQLQKLVVSGKLPCAKDEAVVLAGIQLRIEESCPADHFSTRKSHPGPNSHPHHLEDVKEATHEVALMAHDIATPDTVVTRGGVTTKSGLSTMASVPFPWRRGFLRQCMEKTKDPTSWSLHIESCIPPAYHSSKNIMKLVKEQKRKLFHTSVYESETQLKKLYVQTCHRLPAFGCQMYQVKELLRGRTKKKATRLLGIGLHKVVLLDNKTRLLARSQPTSELQQWRAGGGRSHDRLVLEFRGTKWSFVTPSVSTLKSISSDLWEIMQEIDNKFLEENSFQTKAPCQVSKPRLLPPPFPGRCAVHAEELEAFHKLLNFPEDIALRLTETEYALFYQVSPVAYVRHVTHDLSGAATQSPLHVLVKRFNEVSSWVTHTIISQPTHEDRKAVVSCILRVTMSCWNQGNFNGATEFLAGLKSEKLKPFWLSVQEKEEPLPIMDLLGDILLNPETAARYEEALERALAIQHCKVVPFFGHFLRQLQSILTGTPSLIVLPPTDDQQLEFVSDFHGEDHFMTRIGTGGLINNNKLDSITKVLRRIQQFHDHHKRLDDLKRTKEPCRSVYDLPVQGDGDAEYEVNPDLYQPIQPIGSDHGVSFIPLGSHPDLHMLQLLHHGSSVAHWESDSSRLSLVFLRLERSCSMITWTRSTWGCLRPSAQSDLLLNADFEQGVSPGIILRYTSGEVASLGLEEGYLELTCVKEVVSGRTEVDAVPAIRRMGVEGLILPEGIFSLVFGTNLSDNRVLDFIAPVHVASLWYNGLLEVVRSLKCQQRLSDQRLQWLREQYLQLYYEDGACSGPTPAEAIKVFGGRKWTLGTGGSTAASPEAAMSSFKRASSLGMNTTKFRKKRSQPALPASGKVRADAEEGVGSVASKSVAAVLVLQEVLSKSPIPGAGLEEPDSPKTVASTPHGRSSQDDSTLHVHLTASIDSIDKAAGFREKDRKPSGVSMSGDTYGLRALSITHATQLDFVDFLDLFRAFSLRTRKDLKDLFEQMATQPKSLKEPHKEAQVTTDATPEDEDIDYQPHGILTRMKAESAAESHRRKICDAIAVASIVANCAGLDTTASETISLDDFRHFLATHQGEHLKESAVKALIKRHEPDPALRSLMCLSFEGFAQYLMDKDNYAFTREMAPPVDDMDHPLSHYYIASSHNTYLTGHQLKGESSVELYSQVLLTGCRCVELDCWDGDDGMPLIYHGHTLTTKIPFKNVVEAINKSAFVTSPYPIILSIENHCSVQQQARMAHIFLSVFGEKLVTRYLFESDFSDDPQLPSPNQLRNRVLIKNKKLTVEPGVVLRSKHKPSKFNSARTNSIPSNTSTDEDEYDDDEDDDDDEEDDEEEDEIEDHEDKASVASKGTSAEVRTESMSSQEESLRDKTTSPRPRSQSDLEWFLDEVGAASAKQAKKQSSQIAQELSDLIIYTQAIKFSGPELASPSNSVKARKTSAVKRALLSTPLPGTPPLGSECRLESSGQQTSLRRQPSTASCYQVSSLNENTTKKLCRKHALPLLAHTERHLMRTYPAGMRIDSSNFNPVIFWAFGIQMVALNYQTEDPALHLNTAMFEQNGQCGFVLKPAVMWDRSHVMYRRFNPWEKEFDGLHATHFSLTVVSGQYVCQNSHTASPQVEMEVMGIPVDCCKQKTRVIQRNALNPIWNDSFMFRVMFSDLAFLRFTVVDAVTNHITAQRILPLRCVRPGYRHLRLRGPQNQPLPLSTIFICTRVEEEGIVNDKSPENAQDSRRRDDCNEDNKEGFKRRLFFLRVYGVMPDEMYTILKVGQENTTRDVILQALAKGNKAATNLYDYVLIEEVQYQWDSRRDSERGPAQRILEMDERPLEAQSKWQGEGKFILKKTGNDPSSRAWISTIMVSSQKEKRKAQQQQNTDLDEWEEEEATFLVCVHNVSPEIPYAILRAPMTSTSQDIITQALVKARRLEEPSKFVLIEELDVSQTNEGSSSGKRRSHHAEVRVLADEEKVYDAQTAWKITGRFTLKDRAEVMIDRKKSPPVRYPSLGNRRWCLSTRQRSSTERSFDNTRRSSSVREGDARAWDSGWDQYWRHGDGASSLGKTSRSQGASPDSSPNDKSATPSRLKLTSLRKLWVWR